MNKRFSVAFIVGQLGLGGAEQQLYHLLSGIDRNRFQPIVINLGATPDEYWYAPIIQLGIPVQHVDREGGRVLRLFRVAHLLYRAKAQIVHGWVFHCNPYAALAGRLAGVPIRLGSMRENYQYLPDGKVFRRIGCLGLDLIITNSAKNAEQIIGLKLTHAGIRMVPNGVKIPDRVGEDQRRSMKLELGCIPENLLVGTIGRLDENKNHSMLLRALARLADKWPNLDLVIIGTGPLRPRLAALSEELGIAERVHLPGSIPLAARYLKAMDVCTLTSYNEGTPNLIMEAAAAGVASVATNCGDVEYLIEDGVSGYFVPPDDYIGLASRINQLLEDVELRSRIGLVACEKMSQGFSIASMVNRMSCVYDEMVRLKNLA